jgi:hypothetical protein
MRSLLATLAAALLVATSLGCGAADGGSPDDLRLQLPPGHPPLDSTEKPGASIDTGNLGPCQSRHDRGTGGS